MTAILSQVQVQLKADLVAMLTPSASTAVLARVYWGMESNETAMPYAECFFYETNERRADAMFVLDTDCKYTMPSKE